MRKVVLLLFSIVFLSSCGSLLTGTGKLHYVKSDREELSVVDRKDASSTKEQTFETESSPFLAETIIEEVSIENESIIDHLEQEERQLIISEAPKNSKNIEQQLNDDEDMVEQAYEAERAANTSFILMLVGIISAFLPFIGIIPFGIGLYFFAKSSNARYTTPFGERKQHSAKVIMIIDAVILTLWLLAIVGIILL